MSGFLSVIKGNSDGFSENDRDDLLIHKYQDAFLYAETRWVNKFLKDKSFHESERFFVLTDGVIFNLHKLYRHYECNELGVLCEEMYETEGENFFRHFRGSFSGLLWDKVHRKLIVFADHIGDKPIFFARHKESLVIGTELNFVINYFRYNQISYNLNESAAWHMVTFGFLLENNTFFKEISKLCAGQYLVWIENDFAVKSYHHFAYLPDESMSENYIIDCADDLFTQAVRRQTDKNEEYDYENIALLDTGIDTRLVNHCIHNITDKPTLNLIYSSGGLAEGNIAGKLAEELTNTWFSKSPENGNSLLNIDEIVRVNGGMMSYWHVAMINNFFTMLKPDRLGLIHNGLCGNCSISATYSGEVTFENIEREAGSMHQLSKMRNHLDINALHSRYQYAELFSLYNWGFGRLSLESSIVFNQQTESFSPFFDVEFLEFCLTIPVEKRCNNKLYDAWILVKYPEMARYPDNGTRYIGGEKGTKPKSLIHSGKIIGSVPVLSNVDHWYNSNEQLRRFYDQYFNHNIMRLDDYTELKKDITLLYLTGNGVEKNQVLTLLAVLRNYFADE